LTQELCWCLAELTIFHNLIQRVLLIFQFDGVSRVFVTTGKDYDDFVPKSQAVLGLHIHLVQVIPFVEWDVYFTNITTDRVIKTL